MSEHSITVTVTLTEDEYMVVMRALLVTETQARRDNDEDRARRCGHLWERLVELSPDAA